MTQETRKIVSEIIQLVAFVAFLVFLYFAVCCPSARADTNKPTRGEWLCWVNSVKDSSCGTYGWHKQKGLAVEAATKKCNSHCNDSCEVDYCEVVK